MIGKSMLRIVALAGMIGGFASCDLLQDKAFVVESWSPGPGAIDHTAIVLNIVFSKEPDRSRAENAFRLEAGGLNLPGSFFWDGRLMAFLPFAGFSDNSDYRIFVDQSARTSDGLSLAETFEARFTTRDEDGRPCVIEFKPGDGGTLVSGEENLVLRFSEPIDNVAYMDCLSLSPAVSGLWTLSAEGDEATFTPFSEFEIGKQYFLSVSAELKDRYGNRMGQAWQAEFSVGFDSVAPSLVRAIAANGNWEGVSELLEDVANDDTFTVNDAWEAGNGLLLEFDQPVLVSSVQKAIRCDGGPQLMCKTESEYAISIRFVFADRPEWQSLFSFRLEAGVKDQGGMLSSHTRSFWLRANGPASKPPEFVGIRLPLAPRAEIPEDRDLRCYAVAEPYASLPLDLERFPIGVPVRVDIELYVRLAQGAAVDRLSLMESIRAVIENSALDLSIDRVRLGGFSWAPVHEAWNGCSLVTLETRLTNRASVGVLRIVLAQGLHDSLGNPSEQAQSLPLLK